MNFFCALPSSVGKNRTSDLTKMPHCKSFNCSCSKCCSKNSKCCFKEIFVQCDATVCGTLITDMIKGKTQDNGLTGPLVTVKNDMLVRGCLFVCDGGVKTDCIFEKTNMANITMKNNVVFNKDADVCGVLRVDNVHEKTLNHGIIVKDPVAFCERICTDRIDEKTKNNGILIKHDTTFDGDANVCGVLRTDCIEEKDNNAGVNVKNNTVFDLDVAVCGILSVDDVVEKTLDHGVCINSTLLVDVIEEKNEMCGVCIRPRLKVDQIDENTTDAGVTIEGILLKDNIVCIPAAGELQTDTINEKTSDVGVTIEGVVINNNNVCVPGEVQTDFIVEKNNPCGVTIRPVLKVDQIQEDTESNGVCVSSVLKVAQIEEKNTDQGVCIQSKLIVAEIEEKVPDAGVCISGCDNKILLDVIEAKTGGQGGIVCINSILNVDNIQEKNGPGVRIEDLKIEGVTIDPVASPLILAPVLADGVEIAKAGILTDVKGDLTVRGDTSIEGNLVVDGTTTTVNSVTLNVTDAFIFSNSGYNMNPPVRTGSVFNCDPEPLLGKATISDAAFTTVKRVECDITAGSFSTNDFILITGANNAANNGIYEVESVTLGNPDIIVIKDSPAQAFPQTTFTVDATVAGEIIRVKLCVLQTGIDSKLEEGCGDNSMLVFKDIVLGPESSTLHGLAAFANTSGDCLEDTGIIFDGGDLCIPAGNKILVDTINEKTTDAGVTIEGVKIEDNDMDLAAAGTMTIGSTTATKIELADTTVITQVQGPLEYSEEMKAPIGTVTQITSLTTGVTLNATNGIITTVNATLLAQNVDQFTVTNSVCQSSSLVLATLVNYGGTYESQGLPTININGIANGSFNVLAFNAHTTNALNGELVIAFHITQDA